ncbi:MAG: metalloregulator ArsR/SmtB family transcription factor [Chitinophagales bacterium]
MRRDVFQAIADPTRRAIIGLLISQALTPNVLAEKFDSSRQAISKHIQVLHECGLVSSKQVGREIFYQIEPRKLKMVDDWLDPFRKLWTDRFNQLDTVLNKMKKAKK